MPIDRRPDKEDALYTHTKAMESYSATKNDEMMPFAATAMDLEAITLSEVSQTKTFTTSLVWNLILKNDTSELKHRLTNFKNKLIITKGEVLVGGVS